MYNYEPPLKYESKDGLLISESSAHFNNTGTMFIVEGQRGKFHTVNSTRELIKVIHPPKAKVHSPRLSSRG